MNTRLLKAKRVEHGLRQIDLARKLHIAEKTMNKKGVQHGQLLHRRRDAPLDEHLMIVGGGLQRDFF